MRLGALLRSLPASPGRLPPVWRWICLGGALALLLVGLHPAPDHVVVAAQGEPRPTDIAASTTITSSAASVDLATVQEVAKILAFDGVPGDQLGTSVSISGDLIVVGTPGDDDNGNNSGSAHVFVKPRGPWSGKVLESAKLLPSNGVADGRFGATVAVDGDSVIVLASRGGVSGSVSGRVYVFERPPGGWTGTMTETARLLAKDGDPVGGALSISGDTVVVRGADLDASGVAANAIYVFIRPVGGWEETKGEQAMLLASDGERLDGYGSAVSISGDTVVVGARHDGDNGFLSGSAYVFEKPEGGWSGRQHESAKLLPSRGGVRKLFGQSVSISGGTIVIGSGDDEFGPSSGVAFVYVKPPGQWQGMPTENAKLLASDASAHAFLGRSVAISGDTILVGAHGESSRADFAGAAYRFTKPASGWSGRITESAKLQPSELAARSFFGNSVSLSGGMSVVGAVGDGENGASAGAAYVFDGNRPPVVRCRGAAADTPPDACVAHASVERGSFDPDGDPLVFSQDPPGPYGLGVHLVTMFARDDRGGVNSCKATITVRDIIRPDISVALDPMQLWPPDQRLRRVTASVVAEDGCGSPRVTLVSITNSEADGGSGGGQTEPDIQDAELGTPDFDFALRAKRDPEGGGRVYAVVYKAMDGSGNESSASAIVKVPHDLRGMESGNDDRSRGARSWPTAAASGRFHPYLDLILGMGADHALKEVIAGGGSGLERRRVWRDAAVPSGELR